MPAVLAARPDPTVRPSRAGRRRRSAGGAFAVAVVRLLTVLVGLATAAITLGPRRLVVDGMAGTQDWLDVHPRTEQLVDGLGGVEPAGNLVLFVPFAALLALAVGLRFLPAAFLLLLAAPLGVEWTQQYLPGRVPDAGDVVRNTTGLLGAFAAVAVVRLLAAGLQRLARPAPR